MSSPPETIGMELESPGENAPCLHQGIARVLLGEGRARFFDLQTLSVLSKTCADWSREGRPELTERAAKVAIQHIVFGEQKEAEKMIKANPKLLLVKSQARDYSGRTITATPFQAALGAEDERMWEMMRPYFAILESLGTIDSAQDEMRQQFDEQFPEGIESIPAKELQAMYNDLASAIVDNDDNGKEAIEVFRQIITQHSCIESGIHFNMQHLIAAYQTYVDNFDKLGTWVNRDTFCQKVIGFVQRQMPANYAQVYCSGIKNVLENADAFKRELNFSDGKRFFPLSVDAVGLGFDFAVYSTWWAMVDADGLVKVPRMSDVFVLRAGCMLSNYVEQKRHHLSVLSKGLNQQPKPPVTL